MRLIAFLLDRIFNSLTMAVLVTLGAMGALSATPFAAYDAGAVQVPDLLSSVKSGRLIVLPPPGYHLNPEAPATVTEGATSLQFKLSLQKLEFRLPSGLPEQDVAVEVFVCDDAKTFCKKKLQSFHAPAVAAGPAGTASAPNPTRSSEAKPAKPHLEADTGFFVNDPKKAFAMAAKKKLPLMIDFFGIWCPPCNHLDAMVFRSTEFKTKTGMHFVKLKLDADQDGFNELKNRYKIQGLPTVVFTTSSGDEIFRLLGYHPLDEMLAKSEAAYANREEGFAQLEAQATGGNAEARYKAARIALDRDEPQKALDWLAPMKDMLTAAHDPRLADFYRAKSGTELATTDKKGARETLVEWIKTFPDSPDAIENYQTLAGLQEAAGNSAESHASILAAIALTEKLMASPASMLSGTEYTLADVAEAHADLVEKLGDKVRTREAYLACAEAYQKEALAEGTAFPRGPSLERGYCLGKAGEIAPSEALYREGIRRYPGEYTFHQGLAKLWLDAAKDGAKALPEARKAVQYAYGNQRLKATMTLARAFESLQEPAKAIDAINAELVAPAPEGATPSTLALREKLRAKAEELRKKPAATKSS